MTSDVPRTVGSKAGLSCGESVAGGGGGGISALSSSVAPSGGGGGGGVDTGATIGLTGDAVAVVAGAGATSFVARSAAELPFFGLDPSSFAVRIT